MFRQFISRGNTGLPELRITCSGLPTWFFNGQRGLMDTQMSRLTISICRPGTSGFWLHALCPCRSSA